VKNYLLRFHLFYFVPNDFAFVDSIYDSHEFLP
jgi:hypothetical protein